MDNRPEIDHFLNAVERYAGKRFHYRREIGLLIDLAEGEKKVAEFERVLFLAKFITRGFDVLRRSGTIPEETKNLADEIEKNLHQAIELMRSLTAPGTGESDEVFHTIFSDASRRSLTAILAILAELTWIKNYTLDGHGLPARGTLPQ